MKRRIISVLLLITLTITMITGCGTKDAETDISGDVETKNSFTDDFDLKATDKASDEASDEKASEGIKISDSLPSIIESIVETDVATESVETSSFTDISDTAKEDIPASSYEIVEDIALPEPPDKQQQPPISAGLLTAGEWKDNDNWAFFSSLAANNQLKLPSFEMNPIKRIKISVIGEDNNPVKNANIKLNSNTGEVIWEAVSDYNGIAYVFYNIFNEGLVPSSIDIIKNGKSASQDLIEVAADEQQSPNEQIKHLEYQDVTVTLADSINNKSLDLMFVFDTTGSMGDELTYLQVEFDDIAKRVADQNTRFSVNFYRDKRDLYVVNSNEFTSNLDTALRQLMEEYADGGGDYPEAVDQALNDAVFNHSWNADSVKLLFLILDAPPHSNNSQINQNLNKTITEAAKQGIRIIPIASSGVDLETETFLRCSAILTGGTYTFLTDHSGIGGSHLEPTIGDYQVENLNDCIVRIINSYYQ